MGLQSWGAGIFSDFYMSKFKLAVLYAIIGVGAMMALSEINLYLALVILVILSVIFKYFDW